jgi:hypothetical protein
VRPAGIDVAIAPDPIAKSVVPPWAAVIVPQIATAAKIRPFSFFIKLLKRNVCTPLVSSRGNPPGRKKNWNSGQ